MQELDCNILHRASYTGQLSLVLDLVDRVMDLDLTDSFGRIALHYASAIRTALYKSGKL